MNSHVERVSPSDTGGHGLHWNVAMTELREIGYLHSSMRMDWGKNLLEWSNNPRYAYRTVRT